MSLDVFLLTQENLTYPVVTCKRCQGEAKFRAACCGLVLPGILQQEFPSQPAGKTHVVRVGFTNPYAIKRTGHGIEQICQEHSFELVPAVNRSHQIEPL